MNYSNRVQYKRSGETRIEVEAIARYAQGKSPYVGVPLVEDKSRRPAIFLRKHLQAAIQSTVLTALYDSEKHTLTLIGGRSKYVLRDLVACGSRNMFDVRNELAKWAASQRKAVTRRSRPLNLRKDAKRRIEIEKLERKLARVSIYRPSNPACKIPRKQGDELCIWMRDHAKVYVNQRAQRQVLGKLYGKYLQNLYKPMGKFPWADVYADIEAIGLRIDSYNSWSRVRTRKAHKGLSLPDYLKRLHEFAGLTRKPYDFEPHDITARVESYRADRQCYIEACREAQFIRNQIANVSAVSAVSEPLAIEQYAA